MISETEIEKSKEKIDYLYLLNYIKDDHPKKYSDPEKADDENEKEKYKNIKRAGKHAVDELEKMAELCKKKFELKINGKKKWLDGTNQKTKKYLWVQLKYIDNRPESISIFVEKSERTKNPRFRFSLEIKNDDSNEEDFKNYHKHLEMERIEPLVYVKGSNENVTPEILDEDTKIIKNNIDNYKIDKYKIDKPGFEKVQICGIVEYFDGITNDYIEDKMLEIVEKLIPYYDHVIGIDKKDDIEGRALIDMNKDIKKFEFDKNIILYGPPGTGKTYNTVNYAVAICEGVPIEAVIKRPYTDVLKTYNDFKKDGRIVFTTFHQSYSYEEFVEGIKPEIVQGKDINTISYNVVDGIFKDFCNRANNDGGKLLNEKSEESINKENKPYVFIVDEINRGNISKIFGELITLIETTKRKGSAEGLEVFLPYSKDIFSVPENVYIIGTMNSADRSISLIDIALRRRFKFIEMMPDTNVLKDINLIMDGKELNVSKMLDVINQRIEYLYDREHTIGHAFFTGLITESTIEKLANIFRKSIIPLLQEYFYEDYNKIMLVLGDNGKTNEEHKFIVDKKIESNHIFRGNTSDIDVPEYYYEIQESAFTNIESYIEIIGDKE